MMNNRTFGVEIEIGNRDLLEMAKILRNSGIAVYCNQDGSLSTGAGWVNTDGKRFSEIAKMDEYKRAWRVIRDGSVPDGCEVVSPILSGASGLVQVKNVLKAMNRAGAKATQECGLHVHVNASDLSVIELQNVARRYDTFEDTIDMFVSPRRRGDKSRWCNPMNKVMEMITNSIFDSDPKLFIQGIEGRYYKLNLQAYLRHGTVEFRQLEGTTSWTKVCNWIEFCVSFVEASRLNPSTVATYTRIAEAKFSTLPKKARQLMNHYTVDADDISYILGITPREVPEEIRKLNAVIPGFLTKHTEYPSYWVVNRRPAMGVTYPEVRGTWKDGIPVHVVAHMHHLARVQA